VGDCFILTFRAVARASRLSWMAVHCEVTGTLDRVERATQFTSVDLRVASRLPPGADDALAPRTVEKAEGGCLISKSLKAPGHLTTEIIKDDARQVRSA